MSPNINGLEVSEDIYRLNIDACDRGKVASRPASKYHNTRTEAKGLRFQSGREAAGVSTLITLEEHKQVFGLRLQVGFPLPGDTEYRADAVYSELRDGKLTLVVKDFKGFRTQEYKLKKKLFKVTYGIDIEES